MARVMSRSAPAAATQGTLGGTATPTGSRPGRTAKVNMGAAGDAVYLWILIALELAVIAGFRNRLSRYHGG